MGHRVGLALACWCACVTFKSHCHAATLSLCSSECQHNTHHTPAELPHYFPSLTLRPTTVSLCLSLSLTLTPTLTDKQNTREQLSLVQQLTQQSAVSPDLLHKVADEAHNHVNRYCVFSICVPCNTTVVIVGRVGAVRRCVVCRVTNLGVSSTRLHTLLQHK